MNLSYRVLIIVSCLLASAGVASYQSQGAPELALTARTFLASLDAGQTARVRFAFDDEERLNWHFIPRERNGLPIKDMAPHQQALVHAMMSAALGYKGVMKATTIMSLEDVLRQIEGPNGRFNRDPEMYFISVFGEPGDTGTWMWRLEGHHLAVNVTVRDGNLISATPTFMGSNPARVMEGPRAGLRALAPEEDRGRALLMSLSASQRAAAVIEEVAPRDIITGNALEAMIDGGPAGIGASELTGPQQAMLRVLISEYTGRTASSIESATWRDIEAAGFENVYFAWAGGDQPGDGHYYRVEGPTFLIEYDNTQNNNNHVHSVFRDFSNDFGGDTLRAHYAAYHEANAE